MFEEKGVIPSEYQPTENLVQWWNDLRHGKPSRGKTKTFLSASRDPLTHEKLVKSIENSHGRIAIFMHPWYDLHHGTERQLDGRYAERVRSGMQEIICAPEHLRNRPPVFIMEEQRQMRNSKNRIEKFYGVHDTVYFVATRKGNAAPKARWENFIPALKDVGVEEITLGGSYFWLSHPRYAHGCVGCAFERLKDDFIVRLSPLTNPDSYTEIEASGDTKFKPYMSV